MNIRFKLTALALLLFWQNGVSQLQISSKNPQDVVIGKNYYLTYLISQNGDVQKKISAIPAVKSVLNAREARFVSSKNCKTADCYYQAFKWIDGEIATLASSISSAKIPALRSEILETLKKSNAYNVLEKAKDDDVLKNALLQDFTAMNKVIDIYAAGSKPNYPKIDSISFDVKDKNYVQLLDGVRQEIVSEKVENPLMLTPIAAARFLEINERWDTALMTALTEKENTATQRKIKLTDFNKYPYSAILTLGAGPEIAGQPISPGGMLRARTAANLYREGMAPFIIVSGGRVHPYKTRSVEALEMKKYLVEMLGIPSDAVIIEPLARHTTTNFRNAARLMLEYGIPEDKMAVSTSSVSHLDAVEKMEKRNMDELGYMPYVLGKRIGESALEFRPLRVAFRIDADEPLDP